MEEGNSYYSATKPHSLSPYSQPCVTDVNKISTTPIEVCLIISYLKDYVIIPNTYEIIQDSTLENQRAAYFICRTQIERTYRNTNNLSTNDMPAARLDGLA